MTNKISKRLLLQRAIVAAFCIEGSSQVLAQALEEVIVTATRRETSIQDTGITITAFSGDRLRQINAVRFDDIGVQTPGLQFTAPSATPLLGLISIRGVAQNDFASHLEAPNALYVDDVYRPNVGSNLQTFLDVDRVEVLKGPQGTLFGRNATGGLIQILTREPTDETEGYAQVTVGEYNEIAAQGAINQPLTDTLKLRLAASYRKQDGWIENTVGPDNPEDDTTTFRGKLLFEPNDAWKLKLQLEHDKTDQVNGGGGFATGGFVGSDTLGRFRESGKTDTGYKDADGKSDTGEYDFPGKFEQEGNAAFVNVQYSADNYQVTSITAYSDYESSFTEDNDLTPFDIAIFRQSSKQDNFTQELRLNLDYDATRVTMGLYYLEIEGEYFQNYQINNLGNYDQILAPIDVLLLPVGLNQWADYSLDTSSWSIFGQLEHDLTDELVLIAGLRYTEDQKHYKYLNICENLLAAPACSPTPDPATLAGAGQIDDHQDENGYSARLQLDYAVNDDWLLFASYNRGYKAFNYNAGFGGAASLDGLSFDGETLNAMELGSKLDFWDSRGRFNISAFYYDYQDYQAFDQRGVSFVLSNADATIYGADADLSLNPGLGINLQLGVAYLQTEVEDIPVGESLRDLETPQSPELTFNFVLSKTFEFSSGNLVLNVDGSYTDDYFSQLTNAPVTAAGDYWLFNSQVAFRTADERWELALNARNLFDEDALQYAYDITFAGNGLVEQVFNPPRQLNAHLRFTF